MLSACVLGFTGMVAVTVQADPRPPEEARQFSIGPFSAGQAGAYDAVLFPVFETALADQPANAAPDFFAYCIEVDVRGRFEVDVTPGSWSEFPGKNNFTKNPEVQRKVGWIVNNSYPTIPLKELRRVSGITNLSTSQAITGTQYAIWHYTDGVTTKIGTNAGKLRTFLTGSANTGLPEDQVRPAVTLALAGGANTEVGEPIGPIRVEANSEPISLAVSGDHRLIDEHGSQIDPKTVASGDAIFLDIPAGADAGSTELSARVDAAHLNGSILKVPAATKSQTHAQTLILVKGQTATSSDTLTVSWEAPVPPERVAPVTPQAEMEVCEEPGDSPEARLETFPTEGIVYDVDDEAVRPGGRVDVMARPLEGYEIAPAEGWELLDDGTARTTVPIPESDCPVLEELPPPPEPPIEEPAEPLVEEETPDLPPVEQPPAPEPVSEAEPPVEAPPAAPVAEPEPELAQTGSASLGLTALAGSLIAAGAAATLAMRGRRTAGM